jgi:O-antigen/teichoic acid export membrane protein
MQEGSSDIEIQESDSSPVDGSKSYLKNVSLKFTSGVIGFVLSTASGMIVARTLGAEENGTAALLLLIPNMIVWFVNLGVGRANSYLAGTNKHTAQTLVGNSLSLVFVSSLITGTVGWIAKPLFLQYLSDSNITRSMLTLGFLVVPLTLLEMYLQGLLQGLERIAQLSFVTTVRFSSLLALNLVLVLVFKLGVWGVLLSAILASCVCIAAYSYFLRHDTRMRPSLNVEALKAALTFGLQGHVGNVLFFLNLRLDVFIVSLFAGARSVGLYAVSTALAELLPYLSTAFSFVLFPKTAASDAGTASRFTSWVVRLSTFITITAAVGMLLVSRPLITLFYSREFLPALYPLWILLPGSVSIGYAAVIFSDLSGRGKPYYSTYGALISLFVTVILDLWLIPRWDIIGAATASSAAHTINAAMALLFYLRETGTRPADLLLIRKGDMRTGLDAGREVAQSLNRAFRAWWPLRG